ncbi:hypothetical protein ACVINH_006876 [Rhizobium anhuiense]|jgi:hypothetical protein
MLKDGKIILIGLAIFIASIWSGTIYVLFHLL